MIKFSEGELLDILPAQMKKDVDMICMSYALKCSIRRLIEYEMGAMTANFIEMLPEKILDVLAVELRSPYYMDSMDIEIKRKIIKNTLVWHTKAGTASAVSEMIETVFGEGAVVEWPDFTEGEKTPYTFDIITNARFTADTYALLLDIIERVKNERSHLRRILIERWVYMFERAGSGAVGKPKIYVTDSLKKDGRKAHDKENAAAGAIGKPKVTLTNNRANRNRDPTGQEHTAAGAIGKPKVTLTNNKANRDRDPAGQERAAAGTISKPKVTLTNNRANRDRDPAGQEHTAAGAIGKPKVTLTNNRANRNRQQTGRQYAAAGAYSAPHETTGNNIAHRSISTQGTRSLTAVAISKPHVRIGNAKSSEASAASVRYNAVAAMSYPKTAVNE